MMITTLLLLGNPSILASQAVTTCSIVSGEITDVVGDHPGRGWCLMTPESMQIKVHFIGLCRNEPTWENFDTICDRLFSSSSGKLATISKNAAFPLIDDISIPEGTYTHAAIFIDRSIRHSSVVKFATPRRGKSGDPAGDNSTGKVCWSLEMPVANDTDPAQNAYSSFAADCGDEEGNRGFNISENKIIYNNLTGVAGDFSQGVTDSTTWEVYLLDSNRQRDSDLSDGKVDNAKFFIGIQKFNNPVEIRPSTKTVDLGFRLTNTFGVLMGDDAAGAPVRDTVRRFILGGFEFKVNPN